MLDIRKNLIKAGAKVAYNRSGYMATGMVKEVRTTPRNSLAWYGYLILITNDQDGDVSKVKDARSVLVINEC